MATKTFEQRIAALGSPILLASKTGVSGAALASVDLTFVTGIDLTTYTPVFAVFKFNSGALGIAVVRIKTGTSYLLAVTALLTLTSTDSNYVTPLIGAVTASANLTVEITTASLASSTFNIYIYGVAKP